MMKNFSTYIVTLIILCSTSASEAAPFRDVPNGHWAEKAVDTVANQYGFLQGDPNGYFGGNRAISRYEFAKILNRVIEHYNKELSSDREDIENIVSIMELFQNELKVIEGKMNKIASEVQEQNEVINEVNELTLQIAGDYKALSSKEDMSHVFDARVTQLERDLYDVQHKGLFIDTIVKGTINDVRKLGSATAKVFSRTRQNVNNRINNTGTELSEPTTPQTDPATQIQPNEFQSITTEEKNQYKSYDEVEVMQEVVHGEDHQKRSL